MIGSNPAGIDYKSSQLQHRSHWPDVYRGIAILAVVLIHATGHVLSRSSPCGWTWYGIACVNRLLQFAVPAFLFVSAFLNAGSLTRKPDLVDYATRRLRSAGLPFLAASVVGLLFTFGTRIDTVPIRHLVKVVVEGKAYYHLYFMVLIAQLYVLLPWLVRRISTGTTFFSIVIAGIAIQMAIYTGNRCFCPYSNTGSSILWYVLPVLLGVSLQVRPASMQFGGARKRRILMLAVVASTVVYLPLAVLSILGPIDTFVYQISDWTFSTLACIALFAVANTIRAGFLSTALSTFGRQSLGIYLAHPFVIVALDHFCPHLRQTIAPIAVATYVIVAIAITSTASTVFDRAKTWRSGRVNKNRVRDGMSTRAAPQSSR